MASDKNTKLEQGIEAGLRVKPYVHFDVDAEWAMFAEKAGIPQVIEQKPVRKLSLLYILSYAAVILLLVAALVFISKPVTFTETLITKNEKQTVTLFDGTMIEVAENSVIHYPTREKDIVVRRVVLEKGKATFRVSKNELPFVVSSYPLEIKVTGTVFTVEKNKSGVRIDHHEGSVEVVKKGEPKDVFTLSPNDALKVEKGELFLSVNGADFEQKTLFTYESIEKVEKLKTENKELSEVKTNTEIKAESLVSTYRMTDLIDFLSKKFKKELKIKKKKRLKSDTSVTIDLNQPLEKILSELKNKKLLEMETGKCKGCFTISPSETIKK